MAGTTTYYGISYPTSTDYVKDGATAMQTIADGFDSAVAIPTYNNQTGTSYTFVLTDAGKTVTSNNASAVTFTIPPQASVAWANNTTLTVRNLGAGVVTIAGGSGVTVTNTAQTVAQYGEVKLIRTASNAWTVVPASGGSSALTLIQTQSFSGASAVNFTSQFSSTYRNYLFIGSLEGASGTNGLAGRMRSGSTDLTSNVYKYGLYYVGSYNSYAAGSNNATVTTQFDLGVTNSLIGNGFVLNLYKPFLAQYTNMTYTNAGANFVTTGGTIDNNTSYDGFSFYPSGGTITGTISLYGYGN